MRACNFAVTASWLAAAAFGYVTCELVHRFATCDNASQSIGSLESPVPSKAPLVYTPRPSQLDVIDLDNIPSAVQIGQFVQTAEPPLANSASFSDFVRMVHFEIPADKHDGPEPAPTTLPYLRDDDDAIPAILPMLGDLPPVMPPSSEPSGPLFETVRKFFEVSGRIPQFNDTNTPETFVGPPRPVDLPAKSGGGA